MEPPERQPYDRDRGIAEDRRLVTLAQRGDREAFAALVTKYTGMVRALAAVRVGWGPVADDVVQDVFLLTLRRLDTLTEPERFAGWISRIAVNRAREVLRREAPRRTAALDALPSEPAAGPGDDRLEVEDETRRVQAAMEQLDERTQTVLALRFRQGLAVKEVAELLDENPPAVSMRITRGLRRLRELLGEAP